MQHGYKTRSALACLSKVAALNQWLQALRQTIVTPYKNNILPDVCFNTAFPRSVTIFCFLLMEMSSYLPSGKYLRQRELPFI